MDSRPRAEAVPLPDAGPPTAASVMPPMASAPPALAPSQASSLNQPLTVTPLWLWGVLSALAMVAGSLGPWAALGPFSASGTSGDGTITLVVALIVGALAVMRRSPGKVAIGGAAAFVVAVYDIASISSSDGLLAPDPGWGVLLVAASGVSLAGYGITAMRAGR